MYEELVKALRETRERVRTDSFIAMFVPPYQLSAAADAIETLSNQNETWEEVVKTSLDYIPCWVSVSNSLPEDGIDVLCRLRNDAGDIYATVGCYNAIFKQWDLDSEYALSRHVTHWMPLPEMPED